MLVFENRGREVGATIDHPHGQIYGYPFVPPAPAREAAVMPTAAARCAARSTSELDAGTRIVAQRGDWVAWVPFASGYAYGMRFAPRTHVGSLAALDDASRDDLAGLLVDVLGRYDRLWPAAAERATPFPYLLWFHQAPAHGGDEWHLHAHLAPPLRAPGVPRYVASGELGQRDALEPRRARGRGAGTARCLNPPDASVRPGASTSSAVRSTTTRGGSSRWRSTATSSSPRGPAATGA